jgi:tetratricopeptide (TPR) repeat protein
MLPTGQSPWRLKISDAFELRSPSGELVSLPYRKPQELLVLLASSPSRTCTRDDLQNELWPQMNSVKRQVSLRQAIYQLRRSIGFGMVLTDSKVCRLSDHFLVSIDAADSTAFRLVARMPEQEVVRIDHSPVGGLLQLLQWFAENDPMQMLEVMRVNYDICIGIRPAHLHALLHQAANRVKIDTRAAGWFSFWRGYEFVNADNIGAAREHFNIAIDLGLETKDYVLAVEALNWLGASEVLMRRLGAATRLSERGAQIVQPLRDLKLKARVEHLKATILIHQARTKEGLDTLQEVSDAYEDRLFEFAQNEALRGLYNACTGNSRAAIDILEGPSRVGRESGHFRLQAICGLAEGYVSIYEGEPEKAIHLLNQLLMKSAAAGTPHFEIYSREAIAVALWKIQEQPDAVTQFEQSQQLRRTLKMAYTDWDQQRLRPLIGSVSLA